MCQLLVEKGEVSEDGVQPRLLKRGTYGVLYDIHPFRIQYMRDTSARCDRVRTTPS